MESNESNRKKNPLYVVTNKGKDVEIAKNYLDALIKLLGIAPVIDFIKFIINFMVERVTSYSTFVQLKNFLDNVIEGVNKFTFNRS